MTNKKVVVATAVMMKTVTIVVITKQRGARARCCLLQTAFIDSNSRAYAAAVVGFISVTNTHVLSLANINLCTEMKR